MNPYLKITRPVNGITMGMGLLMAYIIAGSLDNEFPFLGYIYLIIAGFFVTSHAMVLNDIIDLEIDKINAPHRPLPSGAMSVKNAKIYSLVLLGIGLIFFGLLEHIQTYLCLILTVREHTVFVNFES